MLHQFKETLSIHFVFMSIDAPSRISFAYERSADRELNKQRV